LSRGGTCHAEVAARRTDCDAWRWLDGLRHQEVRARWGRPGEHQGRRSLDAAGGDAGAHQVDTKADAAGKSASAAQQAADAAKGEAVKAGERAAAVEASTRRLVYEVVLSEDQGNFKFGKTDLPDTAKQRIDQMITDLKADPKGVFIELEGHTDNVGSKDYNTKLGQDRAEAVKRYLYEAHQVPLHKINVISYGEEKPVSPNNNKDGRAQNRRVVIKVLA
jgi:peptidoglycan-associated lipoprotein